jgi:hypothetical protein
MTVLPTVRRQLLQAAQDQANRPATRMLRPLRRLKVGHVLIAALAVIPVLIAAAALVLLSHGQIPPTPRGVPGSTATTRHSVPRPANRNVRVRVVQGSRYCISRRGEKLERCPTRSPGLIRLGGIHQQWLVIFSFIAPRPASVGGRTYYYFTAEDPGPCPNAGQFGENHAPVRTHQRVVLWVAFDKYCPGPGRGTISLVTRRNAASAPGEGATQRLASFSFVIPPASPSPTIDPAVAAQLSVFKRAHTTADALPAAFAAALRQSFAGERPDVADARRVRASDGQAAYLVPSSGGVCVINANEAFCTPAASLPGAQVADLCSPTLPKGQLEIEWLLPDGTSNVAVGMANGTTTRFAPGLNVYIARFPIKGPVPRTVEWNAGQHHHSSSTPVPSDVHSQKCAHPSDLPPASQRPGTPRVLIGPQPRVTPLTPKGP